MTETDPEKRLIGYACISTHGQMLDTQLSRAHLRRRRRSGIGRLTDPTAAAQLWLRAGSSCPEADPQVGIRDRPSGVVSGHSDIPRPKPRRVERRPRADGCTMASVLHG